MVDKLDEEAYRKQLAEFDMNEQAQWTCYHEAKKYGDADSVGEAMRLALEVRQKRAEFCAQVQAATAPPPRQYVSDETRAARGPGELDAYDLGKICGISPEEYMRQFSKLAEYKRTRGDERK